MPSRAWKRAAAKITLPVEYLCIQKGYGDREIRGWIPIQAARECGLGIANDRPRDLVVWIDFDVKERMHRHPLWVTPERWDAVRAPIHTLSGDSDR